MLSLVVRPSSRLSDQVKLFEPDTHDNARVPTICAHWSCRLVMTHSLMPCNTSLERNFHAFVAASESHNSDFDGSVWCLCPVALTACNFDKSAFYGFCWQE
mmetsp:Transcript_4570/g.7821  ORF Transcript_4570/g.7821 Transcript_4570/m.7821 type:complete len:101 (-) Transcript_4570:181-483(-)